MSLVLTNLNKAYGGLVVVRNVSMEAPAAQLTGLIGPNGAGKTTLFSLVNGVQSLDSGTVSLHGHDLTGQRAYRRARAGLGWTFQVPRPFSHLTVHENLCVAAMNQPGDSVGKVLFTRRNVIRYEKELHERADGVLEFLRLTRVREQFARDLSGGQKKLMELGRVLMLEPSFILLDEPFAGVNPALIEELAERICEVKERGIGFLIIEHNIGALSRLVGRMIVMDRGEIIGDGAPDVVLADERIRLAYMGGEA
ncbi:ABC transporter ATP-binding protein [Pseudochelatococcus sp. B33]